MNPEQIPPLEETRQFERGEVPRDYRPVTVAAARRVAEEFDKAVVVICAIDRAHGMVHYTTFGREDCDKLDAARYGDAVARVVSAGQLKAKTVFEDFRLDAAKNKRKLDVVLAALKDITPAIPAEHEGREDCDCVEVLIPLGQIRAAILAIAEAA